MINRLKGCGKETWTLLNKRGSRPPEIVKPARLLIEKSPLGLGPIPEESLDPSTLAGLEPGKRIALTCRYLRALNLPDLADQGSLVGSLARELSDSSLGRGRFAAGVAESLSADPADQVSFIASAARSLSRSNLVRSCFVAQVAHDLSIEASEQGRFVGGVVERLSLDARDRVRFVATAVKRSCFSQVLNSSWFVTNAARILYPEVTEQTRFIIDVAQRLFGTTKKRTPQNKKRAAIFLTSAAQQLGIDPESLTTP